MTFWTFSLLSGPTIGIRSTGAFVGPDPARMFGLGELRSGRGVPAPGLPAHTRRVQPIRSVGIRLSVSSLFILNPPSSRYNSLKPPPARASVSLFQILLYAFTEDRHGDAYQLFRTRSTTLNAWLGVLPRSNPQLYSSRECSASTGPMLLLLSFRHATMNAATDFDGRAVQ